MPISRKGFVNVEKKLPRAVAFSFNDCELVIRYEKRYMEELKLKEAEQLKDDKVKQTPVVGEADKAEGTETNKKNLTSKSSSSEQDLDTFLLGDLEDSDGGQGQVLSLFDSSSSIIM